MTGILAITLNPSIDIATSVDQMLPTRKLRCAKPHMYPGGGGVNVARVAVRLGADTQLLYPTGGATGLLLRRLVDAEGIPNLAIDIAEETREDFTVFEDSSALEYRFVLPGPEFTEPEWRKCLAAIESMLAHPAIVVASGSLPPGVPADFYAQVARIVKQAGARYVIDTSGEALAATLKEGVFLVKPNLRELKEFTPLDGDDDQTLLAAAREMIRAGMTELVALTLGDDGALLVAREQAWRAYAPKVETLSAVGAGDSFLGALLAALVMGRDMPDVLRDGVAAGAAAVLTPGTALCNREDVERLRPLVQIEPL
jgi:6-phosphofructokinase 2